MRQLPLLPTLFVAAAVATMIGLGIWQLQRAAWKEALLAEYGRAAALPAVDLDPLLAGGRPLPALSFRRALVTCDARDAAVEARAGRNLADATGQAYYVPCRPGASGPAGRLRINAGWATRPDAVTAAVAERDRRRPPQPCRGGRPDHAHRRHGGPAARTEPGAGAADHRQQSPALRAAMVLLRGGGGGDLPPRAQKAERAQVAAGALSA